MKKKVSIIVPAFNRLSSTIKCVESLINQTINPDLYEILLIDDGSSDLTQAYFSSSSWSGSNFIYLRNHLNLGRVGARNRGILEAQGEILIFLDNDMVVEPYFINAHIGAYARNLNDRIAVIGNISYPSSVLTSSNFGRYIQSRAIGHRSDLDMIGINLNNLDGRFFPGGNSSCRRCDALQLNMFDAKFEFYGGEDEDFGYRLQEAGVKLIFESMARSEHRDDKIDPRAWRIKYIETGHYGLKSNEELIASGARGKSLILVLPYHRAKDNFKLGIKKLSLTTASIFPIRFLIELFVYSTDRYPIFYCPLLYKYLIYSWLKIGFEKKTLSSHVDYV
jgi:GT2 family glycosyltransferase